MSRHFRHYRASFLGLMAATGLASSSWGAESRPRNPEAAALLRACPASGAGFLMVPGTEACLKLLGRVRTEYIFEKTRLRGDNHNAFRVRGHLGFDHRQATESGLLRTYARAFFQRQNGADSVVLEYAFIQFAGLTAGRVAPVFEHGWSQFYSPSGYGYHADISYGNSLGYTLDIAPGLAATLAIAPPGERRLGGLNGLAAPAGPLNGNAGAAMPDLVASLAYDRDWGSLKLSGALTRIRPAAIAGQGVPETRYGMAVEGAAKFQLPFLAKGSNIWLAAGYTRGALSYNGFAAFTLGAYAVTPVDHVIPTGSTRTELTISYAVSGALQIFVTPGVAVSLGGSHAAFDPHGARNTVRSYAALGQIAWMPATGFVIGLEGTYRRLSFGSGTSAAVAAPAANGGTGRAEFAGRLRLQRDF